MGGLIEDCATQSVGDRYVLESWCIGKVYRMLHEEEKKRKGKWQPGIESPYIHNSFFLPRH
jgi:hypothetical protein